MRVHVFLISLCCLIVPLPGRAQTEEQAQRWSAERANAWYARQPWLVGANYVPSNAINELEMFQAPTFDGPRNDLELGLAESIGMNTVRVFLHYQLWEDDRAGLLARLDQFLGIAAKHHIRVMLVLFDSCWDPEPRSGPQHAPVPGVHNSGWVQSPGAKALMDRTYEPKLQAYVQDLVERFANDDRVLAWDVWNEPDNEGGGNYQSKEPRGKTERVAELLPRVFAWARAANPAQPLTSGVWTGDWSDPARESAMTRLQLAESDIITFHNYGWPEIFEHRIVELLPLGRPILCTEYMARGMGSTFDESLPRAKRHNVAAINWGLVAGKTQTYYPWDSWERPYVTTKPGVWFHEVFREDDTSYRPYETELIRRLTGRGTSVAPAQ